MVVNNKKKWNQPRVRTLRRNLTHDIWECVQYAVQEDLKTAVAVAIFASAGSQSRGRYFCLSWLPKSRLLFLPLLEAEVAVAIVASARSRGRGRYFRLY
jgi:hypothetical protein